jgi:hypothetical protein
MAVTSDGLTPDEAALLGIFKLHGPDGRTITQLSLSALSPSKNRDRLEAALRALKGRGLVAESGFDSLTQKPIGHRLVRTTP